MKIERHRLGIIIELDHAEAENLLSDLTYFKSLHERFMYSSTGEIISQLDEAIGREDDSN